MYSQVGVVGRGRPVELKDAEEVVELAVHVAAHCYIVRCIAKYNVNKIERR
jgi:hypothetical protein